MAQSGAGTAIVPYRNRTFLGVVTDEEGFQQPRRPRPKGVVLGELPVTHREASQRLRRASNYAPLIDDDDDDDYDMSYPPLTSLHESASSSSAASSTLSSACSSGPLRKLSQKKKEKRDDHEFKQAIQESNRLNRSSTPNDTSVSAPPPSGNSDDPAPTPTSETGPPFRTPESDRFSVHQDGSTGEVTRHIDPDIIEQPASREVPSTRLGFIAFESHPIVNEPLFDPTTAQRLRHRQLMDEANRNEHHWDYYGMDRTELGIIEPDEDDTILTVDNWEDIMVEVVLDSGACRHVMARENAPGYQVHDSSASRRGLGFIVGNGERIPNEGQFVLNLDADDDQGSVTRLAATFQVADLTRPLMSVSQLCEQGFRVEFKDTHALVIDSSGRTACRFQRSGQLYTSQMTLKAPEPFHRPS
jgi:hypothetical protein